MASTTATKTYRETQVLTAPPEHLQLMLYDGALRWSNEARLALVANDRETACAALERARRIILYLIDGLRPEHAPELCALMASAYQFVFNRLVDAALNGATSSVDEAVTVLSDLRAGWADLVAGRGSPAAPAAQAPPQERIRLTG